MHKRHGRPTRSRVGDELKLPVREAAFKIGVYIATARLCTSHEPSGSWVSSKYFIPR